MNLSTCSAGQYVKFLRCLSRLSIVVTRCVAGWMATTSCDPILGGVKTIPIFILFFAIYVRVLFLFYITSHEGPPDIFRVCRGDCLGQVKPVLYVGDSHSLLPYLHKVSLEHRFIQPLPVEPPLDLVSPMPRYDGGASTNYENLPLPSGPDVRWMPWSFCPESL